MEADSMTVEEWQKWMGVGKACKMQINSFQPFQSPVDGKMINNRNQLSSHNREHGVEQVGDEYINKREEYIEKTSAKEDVDESIDVTTDIDVINQLKGN